MTLEDIEAALRVRFPERTHFREAAVRVHYNLETEGPVCEVDRLFLGGPNEDDSDVDILIERTLVAIRARNDEATP